MSPQAKPGDPIHVVRDIGDKLSLCGIKHPLPVMWSEAVGRRAKRGAPICPHCAAAYGRPWPDRP